MALSSFLFTTRISVAHPIERPRLSHASSRHILGQLHGHASQSLNFEVSRQQFLGVKLNQIPGFVGVPRISYLPNTGRRIQPRRKSAAVSASWLAGSQLAGSAFTLGTVLVLPFYTAMVVAPKSNFTKKLMGTSIPYMALGLLYAYLLYQAWTPETMRLMFASQYWLPELPGIAKMFSSEMTLASAWIHLLAVDLFAARQIYFDGLRNNLEMRHSISLCLLFCPIGVLVHFLTKAFSQGGGGGESEAGIHPLDK